MSYLGNLKSSPVVLSKDWCNNQPCIDCGDFFLGQPTSSFIVLALAVASIILGIKFIRKTAIDRAYYWWGMSFLIGGIGAVFAGLSFQAFGFELKCRGFEVCAHTSWLEITYNILTVISSYTLLIGTCLLLEPRLIKQVKLTSISFIILYFIITAFGIALLNPLLLSFEIMGLFAFPAFIFILFIAFQNRKTSIGTSVLSASVILVIVLITYFIYDALSLTFLLWQQGIWLSDNDIFHIGMLLWVRFVWRKVYSAIPMPYDSFR